MAKVKVDLKPCPFCGGKAELTTNAAPTFAGIGVTVYVSCRSMRCRVSPQVHLTLYANNTKQLATFSVKDTREQWAKRQKKIEAAKASVEPKVIKAAAAAWNKRKYPHLKR